MSADEDFSNEQLDRAIKKIYHLIVARALECGTIDGKMDNAEARKIIDLADRDFKETLKWNPKHLRCAFHRHQMDIFENDGSELLQMLAAFKLGAIKDDETALSLYDEWQAHHAGSLDWLKEQLRALRPHGQKPSPAHRIAMILEDRELTLRETFMKIRDLSEIAAAIERMAGAQ